MYVGLKLSIQKMTKLNILESETPFLIEAKTCGFNKKKSITYHFKESSYSLCLDNREIMLAQIQACNRLLKYATDVSDRGAIDKELTELKSTLDVIHF
ncbi:hypothetical protein [Candidatus Nitrosocosmicus sp. R]